MLDTIKSTKQNRLHDKELPEVAALIEDWGWAYPSEETIETARQVVKYRKNRIGEVVVFMGLCTEEEKETLAGSKPKDMLLIEYMATQLDSVRREREAILTLACGYPFYRDFNAITIHPELKTNKAILQYCNQQNAVLMEIEKQVPLILFSTYQGLRSYIQQGKEAQLKNPIKTFLQKTKPDANWQVGVATQQEIGALMAKVIEQQQGDAEKNDEASEDTWYAFQSSSDTLRRFSRLMDEGISEGATDVSLIPHKHASGGCAVTLRQHGIMHTAKTLPSMDQEETAEVIRFLLTRSGANPEGGALREPRDGQMTYISAQGEAYVRCSFIPAVRMSRSAKMEPVSVSLRLLPRNKKKKDVLGNLKLSPIAIEAMGHAMAYSQGLVILAGPTSSGKSTTIAGMLAKHQEQFGDTKKRLSIEDPVEQYLPGITQFQVPPHMKESGFADIMRAILRHDPDVVWIGEIRDAQTAMTAVRAASSGHLVLTTVHANDCLMAWKVIDNMIDPADRMNLIESLSLIVSQRLVRTACKHCSSNMREVTKDERDRFRYYCEQKESGVCRHDLPKQVVNIHKEGCSHCTEGYDGVTPINEVLPISREIKDLLHNNAGSLYESIAAKRKLTLMDNSLELLKDGRIDIASSLV